MSILLVSPEVAQFGGGQASELARRLPPALAGLGHRVTVVAPAHGETGRVGSKSKTIDRSIEVVVGDETHRARLHAVPFEGCDYQLVESETFFDRGGTYGDGRQAYVDNGARFGFLAAVAMAIARERPPDVVHGLDWPGALALLRVESSFERSAPARVLSFFDLANPGWFDVAAFHELGLAHRQFEGLRLDGRVGVLRGGLQVADLIVTPSAGFAHGLRLEENAGDLHDVFARREADTLGVLTGLDEAEWDPRSDRYLKSNYNPDELVGKRSCKLDLQAELDLTRGVDELLVAVVGALDRDHGVELVADTFADGGPLPVQLAVVATGGRGHHDRLAQLARGSGGRIGVVRSDQELMLRKALAGADLLLDASPCEPSGRDVMRGMRYGTLPIVHASGAHDDLVTDVALANGDGFKLDGASPASLRRALVRALECGRQSELWLETVARAMTRDRSWLACARQYEGAYRRALDGRRS